MSNRSLLATSTVILLAAGVAAVASAPRQLHQLPSEPGYPGLSRSSDHARLDHRRLDHVELDVRTLFDAGDSRLLPRAFPLLQQALATIPKGSALHMEVTFAGKRITYQHPASRHALAAQRARAIREALDHLGYTVAIIDIDEDPTSSASPATTIFKFCPSE